MGKIVYCTNENQFNWPVLQSTSASVRHLPTPSSTTSCPTEERTSAGKTRTPSFHSGLAAWRDSSKDGPSDRFGKIPENDWAEKQFKIVIDWLVLYTLSGIFQPHNGRTIQGWLTIWLIDWLISALHPI